MLWWWRNTQCVSSLWHDNEGTFTSSQRYIWPFKCYVTLFSGKLDPRPPPRNANNVEPYTSVTLFSQKMLTPPPPSYALRNTRMAPLKYTHYNRSLKNYRILYDVWKAAQLVPLVFPGREIHDWFVLTIIIHHRNAQIFLHCFLKNLYWEK